MEQTLTQAPVAGQPIAPMLPEQLRCKRCSRRLGDVDGRAMAGRFTLEIKCPKTGCSALNRFSSAPPQV